MTEGNDHIVGYGDAVRGRGLLRPGAVLSVPQKSPRAPGLRLPIRSTPQGGHRVTIGTCLKISQFLFFLWPSTFLYGERETSAVSRLSPPSLIFLLSTTIISHPSLYTFFLVSVWLSPCPLLYLFCNTSFCLTSFRVHSLYVAYDFVFCFFFLLRTSDGKGPVFWPLNNPFPTI